MKNLEIVARSVCRDCKKLTKKNDAYYCGENLHKPIDKIVGGCSGLRKKNNGLCRSCKYANRSGYCNKAKRETTNNVIFCLIYERK